MEKMPRFIVVDDCAIERLLWEQISPGNPRLYSHPEELLEGLECGSEDLTDIRAVVLDYWFELEDSSMTGLDLACELRKRGYTGRVLMASMGCWDAEDTVKLSVEVVPKDHTAVLAALC